MVKDIDLTIETDGVKELKRLKNICREKEYEYKNQIEKIQFEEIFYILAEEIKYVNLMIEVLNNKHRKNYSPMKLTKLYYTKKGTQN